MAAYLNAPDEPWPDCERHHVEKPLRTLFVAFQYMDLGDFTGPVEVFSLSRTEKWESYYAEATTVAEQEVTETIQGIKITRDLSIDEAIAKLSDFDYLIIPGGGGSTENGPPDKPGVKKILREFAALPRRESKVPRTIFSVCTGAFFLGEQGLLKGKTATTNQGQISQLQAVVNRNGGARLLKRSYVDCGELENGIRIVTAGAVSNGLDAALYLVEQDVSLAVARQAQEILDYNWRKEKDPKCLSYY